MTSRVIATNSPTISTAVPASTAVPTGLWAGFLGRLQSAQHAISSRRTLLEMDARMLKDIGITHAEAMEEARRAPWDIEVRGRRF